MDLSTYFLLESFFPNSGGDAEARATEDARAQAQRWLTQYNRLVDEFNAMQKVGREVVARSDHLEQLVRNRDQLLRSKDARIAELEAALQRSRNSESFLRARILNRAIQEIDEDREKERLAELRSQED